MKRDVMFTIEEIVRVREDRFYGEFNTIKETKGIATIDEEGNLEYVVIDSEKLLEQQNVKIREVNKPFNIKGFLSQLFKKTQ